MRFKKTHVSVALFLISFSLSACGGGGGSKSTSGLSGNETGSAAGNESNVALDNETNNSNFQYDLSEYLFHSNVLVSNGEVNFIEKFYLKDTGEQVLIDVPRRFTSTDGLFVEEFSHGDALKSHAISANNIEETIYASDNEKRSSNRFANIGDTYQDADNVSTNNILSIGQNSSCVLLEHLESFSLGSATGDFNLASGVYNDVLKVECVTSFLSEAGVKSPHTTLRNYFAKGYGIIFSEGTMVLLDDVYIIEEF